MMPSPRLLLQCVYAYVRAPMPPLYELSAQYYPRPPRVLKEDDAAI